MSREQYLLGINMATGLTTRTYRGEVHDHSVLGAIEMLDRAQHERVRMPGLGDDMAITVTSEGRSAMIATIWHGEAPVVTFGVARNSRASAGLWRILLRTATPEHTAIALDESSRPQPPWIAARIEIGAALVCPVIMMAIGGLESAIGFAFLEMP